MILLLFTSFLLFGFVCSAPSNKLPDKILKCHKSDPKIDECLKTAIQAAVPHFVKGVPSLGIFTIDPLRISELRIDQGDNNRRPVSIDLTFQNLDLKGFRSTKIKTVKSDIDHYKLQTELELEQPLILEGDYEIRGKVLILPISGKGKSKLKLDNLTAVLTLTGKEKQKDGKTYQELEDFDVKFETTRLHLKFENLFNGDKALGDNMNKFLNENWNEILSEVKPAFEKALGAAFRAIASRLYSRVPYDSIYLK